MASCVFLIAHTRLGTAIAVTDRQHGPGSHAADPLQRRDVSKQVERRAVMPSKRQRPGVHAHGDMTSRGHHVVEARSSRVSPVGEHIVALGDRELRKRLAPCSVPRSAVSLKKSHASDGRRTL